MLLFFLTGIAGIALHLLMKLNDINQATPGKINFKSFITIEWIPTLISLIVVSILIPFSQQIGKIQQLGDWGALVYLPIGYMGQSLLYKFMKKADKIADTITGEQDAPGQN